MGQGSLGGAAVGSDTGEQRALRRSLTGSSLPGICESVRLRVGALFLLSVVEGFLVGAPEGAGLTKS